MYLCLQISDLFSETQVLATRVHQVRVSTVQALTQGLDLKQNSLETLVAILKKRF